ncbi:MAG: CsgG/HfaB family protein [Planctomycetota bacterium]
MSKTVLPLLLLALICGCAPPGVTMSVAADPKPQRTIAILDFDWTAPKPPPKESSVWLVSAEDAGQAVADQVAALIVGVPGYSVLERTALRKILAEHDLSAAGIVQSGDYKRVGRLVNADSLVVGQVTTYSVGGWGPFAAATAAFGARMVDAESGVTLWVINGTRERGGLQPGMCVAEMVTEIRPHFHKLLKRNRSAAGP